MDEKILQLQKEIRSLPCRENLISILVYGSAVNNNDIANDLDIVIVAREVDFSLGPLFELLSRGFKNLDFNVYSEEEFFGNLSYYTREFKLEYLAKGFCMYGANIFEQAYKTVDQFSYKQSVLIRSIEHLQIVRQRYFSSSFSSDQKLKFLKKYFLRISRNILLFKGVCNHSVVSQMSSGEIMAKLVGLGIFSTLPDLKAERTLEGCFSLFEIISRALIKCKKELDPQIK